MLCAPSPCAMPLSCPSTVVNIPTTTPLTLIPSWQWPPLLLPVAAHSSSSKAVTAPANRPKQKHSSPRWLQTESKLRYGGFQVPVTTCSTLLPTGSCYKRGKGGHRILYVTPCYAARETTIGKMIDEYLKSNLELSDEAIHLLFSANRWELKYMR